MIESEKQRGKRANPRIKKSIGRLVKALERELSSAIRTLTMPCAARPPGIRSKRGDRAQAKTGWRAILLVSSEGAFGSCKNA